MLVILPFFSRQVGPARVSQTAPGEEAQVTLQVQMREVWSLEHTVRCPVDKEFAWNFWTDVRNWTLDPDMQSVELHGGFATGVKGSTTSACRGDLSGD